MVQIPYPSSRGTLVQRPKRGTSVRLELGLALRLETMGQEGDLNGVQGELGGLETEVKRFAAFFEDMRFVVATEVATTRKMAKVQLGRRRSIHRRDTATVQLTQGR